MPIIFYRTITEHNGPRCPRRYFFNPIASISRSKSRTKIQQNHMYKIYDACHRGSTYITLRNNSSNVVHRDDVCRVEPTDPRARMYNSQVYVSAVCLFCPFVADNDDSHLQISSEYLHDSSSVAQETALRVCSLHVCALRV